MTTANRLSLGWTSGSAAANSRASPRPTWKLKNPIRKVADQAAIGKIACHGVALRNRPTFSATSPIGGRPAATNNRMRPIAMPGSQGARSAATQSNATLVEALDQSIL